MNQYNGVWDLTGPAPSEESPLGNWRMGSDDNTAVSVVEGLKAYNVDFKYTKGHEFVTSPIAFDAELEFNVIDQTGIKEAIALAKKSEVVIMVLGEHGLQSGEGRSRVNLDLPGLQQEYWKLSIRSNQTLYWS